MMARTRRRALIGAAIVAIALALPASAAAAQQDQAAPGGIRPDTSFAAFQAQVLTRPQAVLGTDGRRHIAYELVLTGTTSASLKVTRVQVRDAATERVLLSLAGSAPRRAPDQARRDRDAPEGQASSTAPRPRSSGSTCGCPAGGAVPARLDHLVTGVVQAKGGRGPTITGVLTPVRTLRRAPVVLGPPVGEAGRGSPATAAAPTTRTIDGR